MKSNSNVVKWLNFMYRDVKHFGIEQNGNISIYSGDMFNEPQPMGKTCQLSDVELLTPCIPSKLVGLWNNFYRRAEHEGWDIPEEPLYFIKTSNSYVAHKKPIQRPNSYSGPIFFEGELGVVIGRDCSEIDVQQAKDYIFGYTCVNDVTAKEILQRDKSFTQWGRAKSFDTFGVFGPCIVTGIDHDELRVQSILDDEIQQDYAISDMIFNPLQLVSLLSHYMTLLPGDIISCGTCLGAGAMSDGQTIEIKINGIGVLSNIMRG